MKLFRLCNDGLDLVLNSCTPPNNEFGILGIQIYGFRNSIIIFIYFCFIFIIFIIFNFIRILYYLMIDSNNVKRYYHIDQAKIPISPCDEHDKIIEFINLLLNLRVSCTV